MEEVVCINIFSVDNFNELCNSETYHVNNVILTLSYFDRQYICFHIYDAFHIKQE